MVGEFYSERVERDGKFKSNIVYSPKVNIDWPGGYKPQDEPHCGYDGSNCPRDKKLTEIVTIILGG